MKKEKVYIFGPIYLSGEDYLPVYKRLNELCSKYFEKVIGTWPDFWDSKETPREFYDRTYNTITKCDLFIAEVSSPSHGVGMELQMANEHNIPVIALAKDDKNLSKSLMIRGLPVLKEIIAYHDINDLLQKLEKELESY